MAKLQERFADAVLNYSSTGTPTTASSTTATAITGSKIDFKQGEAVDGLCMEWKMAGNKSAANGTLTFTFLYNSNTILTLVADANTAGDFMVDCLIRFTSPNAQKIIGTLLLDTEDPEVNYAATAVDMKSGGSIQAFVTASSGSDTVVSEMCLTKKYMA